MYNFPSFDRKTFTFDRVPYLACPSNKRHSIVSNEGISMKIRAPVFSVIYHRRILSLERTLIRKTVPPYMCVYILIKVLQYYMFILYYIRS